ncbi:putative metal-binding protein [Solirubrobacter pauli]|uniref:Putative metal-binding protein n=1 Tax=Solirubrobacter pauli TaxID=166793 RepID=A0A660LJL1_9ACTN|nr:putative metal-binding motif-containing protein [Solirubrobacter pauli]RKQ93514.1 putative metal-binding protein [Solirubrobacter pauli]
MRAGLIAGALLALAVAEPALGQAEVPCTNVGGGKFECGWFRSGDGRSGGSIVAVGTTTVGYLHQGRNWIQCEEQGGDMRSADGYRNHWFGWTQADNGAWGWASALDASGGDDYGSFGGGTPPCNGAHGTPPSYNGAWGSPPATSPSPPPSPTTPAVDADRDGVAPPTDCDDTNSRVYPGAPEVVGDGIDQDCNGADAAGRVSATIVFSSRSTRTSTRFRSLRVAEAPAGAQVAVTCTGRRKGCPRSQTLTTSAKGSVSLTKLFRKPLKVGARVRVAVTTPNAIGKVRELRIARKRVTGRTLCLAPGAVEATRC